MNLVAIICSVFIIAGSLIPGLNIGALARFGITTVDGTFTLAAGLLIFILSSYDQIRKRAQFGKIILLCGIACLVISALGFINYYTLTIYAEEEKDGSKVLVGLCLIAFGAIGSLVSGIFQLNKADANQGWVANFVANRIAFNRSGKTQQRSFSKFIIGLSITATMIGVAVMIITLAFANGFQETVSQKVFSFWGHIRVQEKQPYKALIAEETPITQNDSVVSEIKRNPEVESIHPFATKYGMLKTTDEIEGVLVKGLDSTYNFDHIRPFIVEGRPIKFNDSSYNREIILSSYTAKQLGLKLNDRILIYFIRPPDAGGEQKMGSDKLTVVGIYKTGIEEYDRTFAIADIKLIRRLNYWSPDQIGGYEIFLRDYKKIEAVAEEIYQEEDFPQTWDTQSVKNISPNIFDWLNMQDVTRNVLIGFMIAVAVINLITCLLILVLERIRMIGILKAIGAKNSTIQSIFIHHALIITSIGIFIGTLIALGIMYLQEKTGFIKLKEEAYYLSEAAVKISWGEIALIAGGTFTICLTILMIPSILVRKIQPVKAIQFR